MEQRIPTDLGQTVWDNLEPYHKQVIEEYQKNHSTITGIESFTCCDCPMVANCESAYELYNTDGDCLELK